MHLIEIHNDKKNLETLASDLNAKLMSCISIASVVNLQKHPLMNTALNTIE